MNELNHEQIKAIIQLKGCYQHKKLTTQQYKTLRGQVLAGNPDAAMRGLRKLLTKQQEGGNTGASVRNRPGQYRERLLRH